MATDGEGGNPLAGLTEEALATMDRSLKKAIELEQKYKNIAERSMDFSKALQSGYEIQEKTLQSLGEMIEKNGLNEQILKQITTLEFASSETIAKINKLKEDALKNDQDLAEIQEEIIQLLEEEKANFDLIKNASRETEQFVGGIAGKLGIATKIGDTAVGKFAAMGEKLFLY
jgi:hypothetical protein